ncbi:hypothetical protein ABZ752_32800 [Streptomyces roseifaciens]
MAPSGLNRSTETGGLPFDHAVHGQRSAADTGSLRRWPADRGLHHLGQRRGRPPDSARAHHPTGCSQRHRRDLFSPHADLARRRPGGLIALAIRYGHLRTAISGNYASRSRDGIHDLLDVETALATVDTITRLSNNLDADA